MSDPHPTQVKNASSVHVLAFSTLGESLVIESEGDFTIGTWQRVHNRAEQVCHGRQNLKNDDGEDKDKDVDMEIEPKIGSGKEDLLRLIIQEQVRKDQRWKQSST